MLEELNQKVVNHVCGGIDMITGHHGRNYLRDVFERFNSKYLKKLLQREPEQKDEEILDFYQKILLHQHFMNIDHAWRNDGDENGDDHDHDHGDDEPAEKPVDGLKELGASVDYSPTAPSTNELAANLQPIKRELSVMAPSMQQHQQQQLQPGRVSFRMPSRDGGGGRGGAGEVSLRIPSSSGGGGGGVDAFEEPNSKNLAKLFKKAAVSATAYRKMDRDLQKDEFDLDDIIQRRSALGGGAVDASGNAVKKSFRRRRSTLRDSHLSTSSGGGGAGEETEAEAAELLMRGSGVGRGGGGGGGGGYVSGSSGGEV